MAEQQNGTNDEVNGNHAAKASMLHNLQAGFDYLKQVKENEKTPPPNSVLPYFLSRVNVTVIDPTVSSISTSNTDNLFDKFANIFESQYDSSLTDVNYQLFRNNAKGVITKLPVKLNVARSHGGGLLLDETSTSMQDYAWERPYCYLYLASCNSFEHYRTKVKPSIQAFVSQLEASIKTVKRQNSGNVETKSKRKHTPAPRYVILYIPSGDRKPEENSPKKGFGSRLRQRMAAARGVEEGATDGTDNVEEPSEQFNLKLSKVEKDILRRFNADFPNGHVCTLSTLNETIVDMSEDLSEKEESWQKVEWGAVQAAMGQAISFGFKDRCYEFDEELRRLDLQRRGDAKPDEDSALAEGLHLQNFFLVKESLAFTYEQMRLPNEALLQYEELRAFLPDSTEVFMSETDAWNGAVTNDVLKIAFTGDVLEFRELLRNAEETEAFTSIAQEYLFVRELALLFQMHRATRISKRCYDYVDAKFQSRKEFVNKNLDGEAMQKQICHIQKEAFNFSWNFRIACDQFLAAKPYPAFAKGVCDHLKFARLRLVDLGSKLFQETLPVRCNHLMGPVKEAWGRWVEPAGIEEAEAVTDLAALSPTLLDDALSTSDKFLEHYLDLTRLIAESNEFCGRYRLAARLRIERMELLESKGDKVKAAHEIISILSIFEQDMWNGCHFTLLFRLAALQRNTSAPSEYLGTLIRCFGESVAKVSPEKAVDALYADLKSVLKSASVKGLSFSSPPVLRPIFGLEGIKSKRSQGTDRNLVKRLYTVGDIVSVTVSLTSFLPAAIDVENVSVDLVPFRKYVAAMEDNVPIAETDVCKVLTTSGNTTLDCGDNTLSFQWIPRSSGQFIIASATILWQGVHFKYAAKELRRPTIRIDIVPCEPTQSVEAFPTYLLPGHDQQLTLKFKAGSDFVLNGKIRLEGPSDVMFLPPNCSEEVASWVPSCEVDLPRCLPAENASIAFTVRTPPFDPSKPAQNSVVAKVSTSYKHGDDTKDEPEGDPMETQLETKVLLLKDPALSVADCGLTPYSAETGLISATIKSNCPVVLIIKEWAIDNPESMAILHDGDYNGSLENEKVSPGDQISFCFEYSILENLSNVTGLTLQMTMENDQGAIIKETLPLRTALPFSKKTKCSDGAAVPIKLSLSQIETMVGTPLEIEYEMDFSALGPDSRAVTYTIDFNEEDWIVSGEISGLVTLSGGVTCEKVSVLAIPLRPGMLRSFPELSLFCFRDGHDHGIPVDLSSPVYFRVTSPKSHNSVAFPTGMSRRASSRAVV